MGYYKNMTAVMTIAMVMLRATGMMIMMTMTMMVIIQKWALKLDRNNSNNGQ